MTGRSRAGWAPLAVLPVAVWFVLSGRMFFLLDAVAEHGSFQRVVGRCLALDPAGVPGWNPWMLCGTPLLADPQMQVGYPPALLYRFLPAATAAGWFVWLHIGLAAAGMASLLAGRGLGGAAALTGAVAYAFGGMPFLLAGTPACLAGYAWLPWIAHWAAGRDRGRLARLAVGFAWLLLGGLPQAVLYGVAAAALGAVAGGARWGRAAAGAVLAAAAGAAVAAVVMVPFALWLPLTTRAAPLLAAAAARDDLAFAHLGSFVAPFAAGLPGGTGILDNRHLWPTFNFIGTLPILLAAAGLLVPAGRRGAAPVLAFVAAGVALGLGANLPVAGPLLQSVPPLSFIRRSALWMMVANLGLAWLAARGVAWFALRSRGGAVPGSAGLACALAAAAVAWPATGLAHFAAAAALLAALLAARRAGRLGPEGFGGTVAVVTWIELLAVGFTAQPALPARWVEARPAEERWLAERADREWFRVWAAGSHARTGVTRGASVRDALATQHARMQPNLLAGAGLRDADGVNPLRGAAIDRRLAALDPGASDPEAARTLALLGVRYVVSADPMPGRGAPAMRDRAVVYRLDRSRPLAWVEPVDAGRVTGRPGERPGRLIATVTLRRAATVVFNQAFAPGWEIESPLVNAATLATHNGLLIAVRLPAGTHAVALRYRVPGLPAGAAVSALALGVVLWLGWRNRGPGRTARIRPGPATC